MSLIERLIANDRVPESVLRIGTRQVIAKRLRDERARSLEDRQAFIDSLDEPAEQQLQEEIPSIAGNAEAANDQHYERPTAFFQKVLGPRLKYSAAMWPHGCSSLAEAEEHTLKLYVARARIAPGQRVLDLGCGWGSNSLFLAERFPDIEVTAVSNSRPQRDFIVAAALERHLGNLSVITSDVTEFEPAEPFDRIVSIEMFEHMRNYRGLFDRVQRWLNPGGMAFVHVFAHRDFAYPYEDDGESDWMARRFFTGGVMPSFDLLPQFATDLKLREAWWEHGRHYQKTAETWLENHNQHRDEIISILAHDRGSAVALADYAGWRLFFIACAELFGYANGREWGVAHYLWSK